MMDLKEGHSGVTDLQVEKSGGMNLLVGHLGGTDLQVGYPGEMNHQVGHSEILYL